MRFKSLYVKRDVLNLDEVVQWAMKQGFQDVREDLHTTVCYSRQPVDWDRFIPRDNEIEISEYPRRIKKLDENAIVLSFSSEVLQIRHEQFLQKGATWDYPFYNPHVTITYKDLDISNIIPYTGRLILGKEWFQEINDAIY